MTLSRTQITLLLIVAVVAVSLVPTAQAFGAGNVPSYSAVEGSCFRHGDLEDILAELLKRSAGGLLGRGKKFGGLDVKRVYFGNWLRDYSQAMDVAMLEKTTKQTILNLVMVLGFLAHGYATGEFEVTPERLGVYLPVEHIDNPAGMYGGKDATKVDPRLRGLVDPRELEIDPRTGMKNFIANEDGQWDTSSALIRRTLIQCIEQGRRARNSGNENELYEAYILLGRSLHTLEDFTAHSNWCELALVKLGHRDVFLHVGDNVKVRAPDGTMIAPITTGTFGGMDFLHSLLGESQDHLSQASVSDLYASVEKAKSRGNSPMNDLFGLLGKMPGGSNSSMTRDAENLSRGPAQDVTTMSPQEIYKNLFQILTFRDNLMMWIETTMEKIPGLNSLVEKISNSLSVFVLTLLEPYVQPIIKQALGGLSFGSAQVINQEDQYEVFNNPNASNPTHSMLAKDHFGLVLNELAGKVAICIVRHCTTLVVKAWDDDHIDPSKAADEALAPIFHPFWFDQNRCHPVQRQMLDQVRDWAGANRSWIARLDRQHVREHTNTRSGKPHGHGESNNPHGQQGLPMGTQMAHSVQNYVGGKVNTAVGGYMPHVPHMPQNMGQGMFREVQDGPEPGQSYQQQDYSAPQYPSYQQDMNQYQGGSNQGMYEGSNYSSNQYNSYPGQQYQGQGGPSEYPYGGPPSGPPPGNYQYQAPPQQPSQGYNPYGGGYQGNF